MLFEKRCESGFLCFLIFSMLMKCHFNPVQSDNPRNSGKTIADQSAIRLYSAILVYSTIKYIVNLRNFAYIIFVLVREFIY